MTLFFVLLLLFLVAILFGIRKNKAGKSSFLNSLLHKEALPVYTLSTASRNPTTTVLPQEITIETQGKPIRFNDTPGLIWSTGSEEGGSVNPGSESDNLRVRDILMRSRGRIDRLKDPLPVGMFFSLLISFCFFVFCSGLIICLVFFPLFFFYG